MKRFDLVRWARQETGAALRLVPLVLVALLLVALFWRTDLAAVGGLFQSSPVETPPVVPDTPTAEWTVTTAPTEGATEQPTAPLPTETLPPAQTDVVAPTEPPAVTNTPTPAGPLETATPVPSPTGLPGEASPTPDESQRYAEGDSNLKFEWGMLFDSVALLLSYLWLCCGGLLFLAIPILFAVLWIASKRRQQRKG
jgi:hypothetical protein